MIIYIPGGLNINEIENPESYFTRDGAFKYQITSTLWKGDSFGEGGIILNRTRTATAICLEDCDLALLSRPNYNKILKEIEVNKLHKKVLLFQSTFND